MMWFWPPVRVKEIATGRTYEVKAVEVAVEAMETWPLPENGKRGPKWRKAYKTCFDALEGMAEANGTMPIKGCKACRDGFAAGPCWSERVGWGVLAPII